MSQRTIIGLSGGFTMEPSNPVLDLYILHQCKKRDPRVCFLPTASGDDQDLIKLFAYIWRQLPCHPTVLPLISPHTSDIEDFLLSSDIIYVGGGNTKTMLAIWREWGVDKILHKAYEQGIILAGVSAGFVCWFQECLTDSIPGKYTVLPCLGMLSGSAAPHFDIQKGRLEAYHQLLQAGKISPGYGIDNGIGCHFVNQELVRVISSQAQAKAYYLSREDDIVTSRQLATEYLDRPQRDQLVDAIFGEPNVPRD